MDVFKDLKVIEMAGVLAGPSVGYFFAELGAQVVKIENPLTNGDVTRTWKLKSEDPKEKSSAYFWSVNAIKKFKMLDITKAAQLELLYNMVREADIIITNYKKGDDLKLKVDYKTLKNLNPEIIYLSINGFGSASERTAYDLILQAESGFMSMNGEQGSKALKMPVALVDLLAGHQAKEAVLIALIKRLSGKGGSYITVSLFDSAVASLVNQATNWLIGKEIPKPQGSLHPNIAPYGELFDTKDKQLVTFAIGSNKQFRALCEITGYKNLSDDVRFAGNHQRVVNRQQLYAILYDVIKQFNYKDLYSLCLEKDVPIGKVRNLKEVFELASASEMVRTYNNNGTEYRTVSGIAFKFEENA